MLSCMLQEDGAVRAVNESFLSFTMPWGPSSSLLGAFSGLLGTFLGFLGPYLAFTKPEKAQESPKKAWRSPRGIVKLSKHSLTTLVLSHP